jgi:hypothetical protein
VRRSLAVRVLAVASLVGGLLSAAPPAAAVPGYSLQLPPVGSGGGFTVSGLVHDAHGNALAGSQVALCADTGDCSLWSSPSDGSGAWSVTGVAAGAWYVNARAPDQANVLGAWYDGATGTADVGSATTLGVSADVTGMDFHLPDGRRITGHVTSPEGDPVAGVLVYAGAGSAIPSGPGGLYQVVGLPDGSYQLNVLPPETGEYPSGVYAAGTVQADSPGTDVVVSGADTTGVDVELYRGLTISGHIAGAAGHPMVVTALAANISYPATVDGAGNFTVTGLFPGSYGLLFALPDQPDRTRPFPYGVYNGQGAPLVPASDPGLAIDATSGNVTGVEAVLPTELSISGTVRDANGPITGATVYFCNPDAGCGSTSSVANGAFSMVNLPPGSYTIQSGTGHHAVIGYAAGRSNPDPFAAIPLALGTKSIGGIRIVLPLGIPVSGTITGTGGVPLAGVDVYVNPKTGGIWEFGPGGSLTDGTGHFTVGGILPGDVILRAVAPDGSGYQSGYWTPAGFTVDDNAAGMIHLVDAAKPVVTAPVAGFRVGSALTGTAVPVQVTWTANDSGTNVKADRLQQRTNSGSWVTVATPVDTVASRSLAPSSTTTYRFHTRATDYANNTSADVAGPAFHVIRTQQSAAGVTWTGSWKTASSASASGGSYRWASGSGASTTYSFSGRAVGWVAAVGPSYGSAKVYLDGKYVLTVDLHAASAGWRRIVFAKTWSASGAHKIRIVGQATAGHPRLDVDAFVVLH